MSEIVKFLVSGNFMYMLPTKQQIKKVTASKKKIEIALILSVMACWKKIPAFVLSNNKIKSNYA